MAYTVSCPALNELDNMMSEQRHNQLRKELATYTKCVKGNFMRFLALTDLITYCGSQLDSDSCAPVPQEVLNQVTKDFLDLLIEGDMRIDGKMNNWSCGSFGSRWCDMSAKKYGLSYIRVAFYSRKFDKLPLLVEKPFYISITCEKAK